MGICRIDHIGINVNDFPAAKEFFLELGLELQAEWAAEGEWVDRIVGLTGVRSTCALLRTADGGTSIELVKFHSPPDENGVQPAPANALGIRHITFAIEDLDGLVARLEKRGAELLGEIQNYQNVYKLCYIRGPEGIILELAERLGSPA